VDELLPFLREKQESLIQEIKAGKYKPNPVRRVEIPKETKYRMLKSLGREDWKAKEFACSRKSYWRMAKVLN
jgi:hypothetical protein